MANKTLIKEINFMMNSWDEKMPMCIAVFYDEMSDYCPEEYLVDDADETNVAIGEILTNHVVGRETEIVIDYMTDSDINLKASVTLTGLELGYFRYKPEYGITFLPPEKVSDETSREMLLKAFTNAEEGLRECIADALLLLVKSMN